MIYDDVNGCYYELRQMPSSVKGCCATIGDADYIFINECLSDRARMEAYRHELRHLERGDLDSDESVGYLEDLNDEEAEWCWIGVLGRIS